MLGGEEQELGVEIAEGFGVAIAPVAVGDEGREVRPGGDALGAGGVEEEITVVIPLNEVEDGNDDEAGEPEKGEPGGRIVDAGAQEREIDDAGEKCGADE